jgi:hypothetical protein
MRTIPDTIRITLMTHRKSGLMVAVSPDVPGLYVHGKSEEEITARIPIAVRALREADRALAAKAQKLPEGFSTEKTYELALAAA